MMPGGRHGAVAPRRTHSHRTLPRLPRPPSTRTRALPDPQDVGILAGIAVVTALALNDAYNHRAKTALKSIAARAAKSGVSAPAAAQEAVGWATMTSNIAYVAAFASLALYVVPNIASLLQTPFGLFAPAVSMLLPAAALAAYGRNLI